MMSGFNPAIQTVIEHETSSALIYHGNYCNGGFIDIPQFDVTAPLSNTDYESTSLFMFNSNGPLSTTV